MSSKKILKQLRRTVLDEVLAKFEALPDGIGRRPDAETWSSYFQRLRQNRNRMWLREKGLAAPLLDAVVRATASVDAILQVEAAASTANPQRCSASLPEVKEHQQQQHQQQQQDGALLPPPSPSSAVAVASKPQPLPRPRPRPPPPQQRQQQQQQQQGHQLHDARQRSQYQKKATQQLHSQKVPASSSSRAQGGAAAAPSEGLPLSPLHPSSSASSYVGPKAAESS
ncbi:hypothetical protein VaNZ11_009872 [Volvox africanus]|uniref:Uncharacterized protein n=1 Tax=Volvox africanus TaxID=51714 RepID=A0ABQ5S993_9CHLO|nr:hypothetical protein VaNZ11_009872 [Volvox africanus]